MILKEPHPAGGRRLSSIAHEFVSLCVTKVIRSNQRVKEKVLFLCTGNSCRSQMAEGLLRHLAGDRYEVASAGTQPGGLNPEAVEAMREIGVDISGHRSKSVEEFPDQEFDYVITVCDRARASCPVFPASVSNLHWSLDDPAAASGSPEQRKAVFRRVRDEIASRLRDFVINRRPA
jgi:arsenate reductase